MKKLLNPLAATALAVSTALFVGYTALRAASYPKQACFTVAAGQPGRVAKCQLPSQPGCITIAVPQCSKAYVLELDGHMYLSMSCDNYREFPYRYCTPYEQAKCCTDRVPTQCLTFDGWWTCADCSNQNTGKGTVQNSDCYTRW
jgi:hypothetical protein